MPHASVPAEFNTSQMLTCESQGQPLSSCLWMRPAGAQKEKIFIGQQIVQDGVRRTNVDGISYVENGLNHGNCCIRIEVVTGTDFGRWSCALMSKSGGVFAGIVDVQDQGKLVVF